MGVTQDLARFAAETPSGRLPKSVVHAAKRAAINALGVALFSSQDPALRILLDLFAEEGGAPRATVWGAATRTSATNAALANGFGAHLEDYDDTHFPTLVHVSAPTLPAAWAAAEIAGASGRDLLTAVALGIEVCSRVCLAFHPWHYDEGWHITGTLGVFGAAAAAGRILGLDARSMARAFGIAGAQSAGVREGFGTMTKPLHAARAAQAGLTAALLAADGFTAPESILEGRRGLGAVLSPEVARVADDGGSSGSVTGAFVAPGRRALGRRPAALKTEGARLYSSRAPSPVLSSAFYAVAAGIEPAEVTLICFGRTASAFGSRSLSTPFSCVACALSASTLTGRLSERWKAP